MDIRKSKMIPASDRLRIVVLGYIVRGPLGGMAWSDMHYLAGLKALGHEVWFLEDSGVNSWCCYDPSRGTSGDDPGYGLEFASRALESIGMDSQWAYYDTHRALWTGPCADQVPGLCGSADLLLNFYGLDKLHPLLRNIPIRVLIDKDPVFTQVRHLTDSDALEIALQHTAFFTFGEDIAREGSAIPDDGLPWQPTRHPIYLPAWPALPGVDRGNFTTVMLWDSYPMAEFDGRSYGLKSESFGAYMDLPRRTGQTLELAVGSPTAPHQRLRESGWELADPLEVTRDPATYQAYIQSSKAEFTVAKHGYVVSRSGWFSERSAAYLASGRPVLTQETGFSDWLPGGIGVIPFETPDQAIAGVEEINSNYAQHCRAAREIAEAYFDSGKILGQFIEHAAAVGKTFTEDSTPNEARVNMQPITDGVSWRERNV